MVIRHIDLPSWCLSVFIWNMVLRILTLLYEAFSDLYVFSDVMPAQHGLLPNCVASV